MTVAAKLNVSTDQEAFTAVCNHLFAMTRRAVTNTGFCSYRTDDGRRCAIGALISDEEATKAGICPSTGGSVRVLVSDGLVSIGTLDLMLLSELQFVHDDFHNWTSTAEGLPVDGDYILVDGVLNDLGREELVRIANKYKLTVVE